MKKISFAIIGGGPAGFYTAKLLSKLPCAPQIHIYEKQLCPFGLIRYGVAPDHISIKKSEIVLSDIQKYQNFHYAGNFNVTPQSIKQMQQKYSGIIFSVGASGDSVPMGLHEENHHVNLPSLKLAREIVYWYNNHPDYEQYSLDLSKTKNVTIVGNGNVAIDVARVFLRRPEELALTEISPNALQSLKKSSIQNVSVVGRRGLVQSAFALKEVRELTKCNIKLYAVQQELQASLNDASHFQCTALGVIIILNQDHFTNLIRLNKRKIDFVKENVHIVKEHELEQVLSNGQKKVIFRFLLNPHAISDNSKLTFNRTYLSGEPFKQKSIDTDQIVSISHDLLVFSTGFQVRNIDGTKTPGNKLNNSHGCIIKDGQKLDIGKYATGWCKTGPQGVIDQTLLGCEETFNNIRIHWEKQVIKQKPHVDIKEFINPCMHSSWEQYKEVRKVELGRGDEKKYIKKKLNKKQILQMYRINEA